MAEPEITEEQLKTLHPLAADVVAAFDETGAHPKFVLTDAQLQELSDGLSQLFETQELRDAVRSLLGVAHGFETQGLLQPAKQLSDLLAEPALLEALDVVNAAREAETHDAVADSSKKFRSFRGDDPEQPSAPKVGEEKPKSGLSVGQLDFPKRL